MLPDNRKKLPCNASYMIVYYRENIESVIALFDKTSYTLIWDKAFKDGPSKILWKAAFFSLYPRIFLITHSLCIPNEETNLTRLLLKISKRFHFNFMDKSHCVKCHNFTYFQVWKFCRKAVSALFRAKPCLSTKFPHLLEITVFYTVISGLINR